MTRDLDRLTPALDAINANLSSRSDDSQHLIAAKCRALLTGYDARWREAGYVAIEVERILVADLCNPESKGKSRSFELAGKIDVLAALARRRYIIDHKTTSQDISDPNSPFWRQLAIEGQVMQYMLLRWLHGDKPDGAVWDVVRKPQIAPKKLSKAEKTLAVSGRSYFNRRLSDDSIMALQTDDRETLEMYEARLVDDCTYTRPEWYFQRRSIPRLDSEILEYAQELWEHSQEILHTRQTDRHLRNSGACLLYNSPCKFLGICSGHDTPESDRWRRKELVTVELEGVEGDGRNLLTNSRVRCYQTCRQKHYYEYELGIERQDEEEKEALFFGSLWHVGLNAWWRTFLTSPNEENHEQHSDDSPANAVWKSSSAAG